MAATSGSPGDDSSAAGLRDQIRCHWMDLAAGRIGRDTAHEWASAQLEASVADNELDIRGVLYLHGPSDDPVAVARALEYWENDIVRFDEDPVAWMREHFRAVLLHVGRWQGIEKARRFGRKLVRNGHLTGDDVALVLDSLAK